MENQEEEICRCVICDEEIERGDICMACLIAGHGGEVNGKMDEQNERAKMEEEITVLIRELAVRRGQDYEDTEKYCKIKFRYHDIAKVDVRHAHDILKRLKERKAASELFNH